MRTQARQRTVAALREKFAIPHAGAAQAREVTSTHAHYPPIAPAKVWSGTARRSAGNARLRSSTLPARIVDALVGNVSACVAAMGDGLTATAQPAPAAKVGAAGAAALGRGCKIRVEHPSDTRDNIRDAWRWVGSVF